MRFVVTGCAGFIASCVARMLLNQGHEVVGIDNMNDTYDVRLKQWRLTQLRQEKNFDFHISDIANFGEIEPLVRDGPSDGIFNLAARAGVRQSLIDPWAYLETNAKGTLNVLEIARRHDIQSVLTASTSSLYGKNNPRPFREDADTEHPLSPYASSKKAAESLCATYSYIYGLRTPVCRYFTVYGPAGRPDMSMFRFVRWIAEGDKIVLYGDGSQERDFTYVDDIARGTILAMERGGSKVYNLGNDQPVKLTRVIEIIESALGLKASVDMRPAHIADVPSTWADIGLARSELGWEPRVSIENGIVSTVKWYLSEREWASKLEMGEV